MGANVSGRGVGVGGEAVLGQFGQKWWTRDLGGRRSPRTESSLALLSSWDSIVLFKAKPQTSILKGQFYWKLFLCGYAVKLYSRVEQLLPRQIVSLEGVLERKPAPPSLHPSLSPLFSPPLPLFSPASPNPFLTLRVLLFSSGQSPCIPSPSRAPALKICIPFILSRS